MTQPQTGHVAEDSISNVLKWVLLAVAVVTFGLLGWSTVLTYEQAPPQIQQQLATDYQSKRKQVEEE